MVPEWKFDYVQIVISDNYAFQYFWSSFGQSSYTLFGFVANFIPGLLCGLDKTNGLVYK